MAINTRKSDQKPSRVLLVANRTATDQPLIQAVRQRAQRGPASFHLLVPAKPRGLHRLVDPEVAGRDVARRRLELALPGLRDAAGHSVTGQVGDANPLAAIHDALHLHGFDEIIISTLPWRLSRWMRVDLPSKVRALGLPVTHVSSTTPEAADGVLDAARVGSGVSSSRGLQGASVH